MKFTTQNLGYQALIVLACLALVGMGFLVGASLPATPTVGTRATGGSGFSAASAGGGSVQEPATFKSLFVQQGITFRSDASQIYPGITSFSVRNSANTADNLLILDNGNVSSRGTLSSGTSLASGTSLTAGTSETIGTFVQWTKQNAITVTNSAVFTPTGSYQPIAAASAVTPTLSTSGYAAGTLLALVNTSPVTITIADTGNQVLSSTYGMTGTDTLLLLFDGTNWVERGRSANH